MNEDNTPRLTLGHTTLVAKDLDAMIAFYRDVLGFHVTNRGPVPDGSEIAFLSQDPDAHHQIAMVNGYEPTDRAFVMVDHLAFRTGTLDDLRTLHSRLTAAGIEGVLQICHGNAWSLYFTDIEGNGLECYVDSPFHVAQPFAQGMDLEKSDEEILISTHEAIVNAPEFQPLQSWRDAFAAKLHRSGHPGTDQV